ncbi:Dolichyl-phosphate-mannose-protein mannosyltransferase [Pricia antarctica]|uniref:Dolichyl-phosphate-mannose-protein mannosyltransferase n=1 Tax=Pricia antarctica TaxID=641691 RepID=A0A1G6Y678_9FLAO|nr:glycosyltransferase family 39 protein [Pricia antarctica]SDD85096.1 Dolichyl-phosphate-mannose-protein mannosyltransferase [Pricia antarctica]
MKTKLPRIFLLLLGAVFLINMLQSYCTPLIFDEAYYWYYAQNMAWGYFDHPPMVAFMIKLGSFLFDGELGVRFVSCIFSVGTFVVIWISIDNPKKRNYVVPFFVLVFSMALLNAYGFFTLPDTPLLFFTALFLYTYKRFLFDSSLRWAIIMGLAMACLMYSKYHAALVIVFVLLSNLKLLANKYAWLSVFVALFCYIPHFIWLYQHDFVTISYHLFDRPNAAYDFQKYTLGYFVNLVAIFGLTFPLIYLSLFKTRSSDTFTKALLYLVYGVLIFFFISSFNRRVQTQWIIVIAIPLAIITFRYMMQNEKVNQWVFRIGLVNIAIILYLRVGLVNEELSPIYYETHGNKAVAEQIKAEVGDTPLIFINSYRNAPMFAFYTGNDTYSLNNAYYRRNQYSIDDSELKLQHQKVLYFSGNPKKSDISFTKSNGGTFYGEFIEDFESFRKLETIVDGPMPLETDKEQILKIYNPYDRPVALKKLRFNVAYLTDFKKVENAILIYPKPVDDKILSLPPNDTINFTFKLPEPKMVEPAYFRVSISDNGLPFGLNGKNTELLY